MTWKKPTAGVILAAGSSERFGTPKQLIEVKGRILINRVVDAALESKLDTCVLVIGHHSDKILDALGSRLHNRHLQIVFNPGYREGLSGSLKCGFSRIKANYPSVMFLLGDQPMIESTTIDHMLEAFWSSEKDICAPLYQGQRKTPTIFSRSFFDALLMIEGDMGAREIIKSNPESVLFVEIDDPLHFIDIDTPEDLESLSRLARESE
jgi:molybdenum cofactor cytidylyltransferase